MTVINTGTAKDDTLIGGVGEDTLDGREGADTLVGGAGNDIYIVDNVRDLIVEAPFHGIDTVLSSVSYRLNDNVENLVLQGRTNINASGNGLNNLLIGNSGNNGLYGQEGNDTLIGNEGDDFLSGGDGADILFGGKGNDIYSIYTADETIVEKASEGIDEVVSELHDYTLSANVENLFLTNYSENNRAFNGTGNDLNNFILGNIENNILSGLDGNDVLKGLDGHDVLLGGRGNDTLDGGAGNDDLMGGDGADVMIGGKGGDTYVVDDSGDKVIEKSSEGIDEVHSGIYAYTLSANLERLILDEDSHATNGTGNKLDNSILGNIENNVLSGLDGNDRLYGRDGNDVLLGGKGNDSLVGGTGLDILTGGAGKDSFHFFSGDLDGNVDIITDFSKAQGDVLELWDILSFTSNSLNIADFVKFSVDHGNTIVSIDADGRNNGRNWVDIAQLQGVTNLSVQDLHATHQILV